MLKRVGYTLRGVVILPGLDSGFWTLDSGLDSRLCVEQHKETHALARNGLYLSGVLSVVWVYEHANMSLPHDQVVPQSCGITSILIPHIPIHGRKC